MAKITRFVGGPLDGCIEPVDPLSLPKFIKPLASFREYRVAELTDVKERRFRAWYLDSIHSDKGNCGVYTLGHDRKYYHADYKTGINVGPAPAAA